MAKLIGEEPGLETSFEIVAKEVFDGTWQRYEIAFNFGDEKEVFKSAGTDQVIGQFVFSIAPENRAELLISQIESFLVNENQKEIIFEPADPSFELVIKRSHAGGFQAYMWVDCGNTKQLRYTWDARGIRFFTTKAHIETFVSKLKAEFKLKALK